MHVRYSLGKVFLFGLTINVASIMNGGCVKAQQLVFVPKNILILLNLILIGLPVVPINFQDGHN